MHRHSAKVVVDGEPQIWIGVNFWSRTGGPPADGSPAPSLVVVWL